MNQFKLLLPALSVLLVSCVNTLPSPSNSNFELVQEVKRQGDDLVIPFKKYVMNNGLTVILHEDNSDPVVHVDVTYHVGSAREDIGKSGFAHFFEHMMFQGSEHVADEQHFQLITEAGGSLNGTTNKDRTNYYQTVPSNQLERVLWLESDRMGFLLDAVTQEKFEVQRETVKNERAQRYENSPYGLLYERVGEAMFPAGHPYSWQTIGYVEDLDRVDVNDLKAFFLRWYGPNNATLTIGGDIDVEQTLAWVEKYFSDIPTGPAVAKPEKPEFSLTEDRYISMEDNVHLPLVFLSFPTVHARHEDEAALDILANILGAGKTSLLFNKLVKDGTAVQTSASHPCQELACSFSMYALPNPAKGVSLETLEQAIYETLQEFEQRGVNDDDLTKTKVFIETNTIYGLQSVSGKVSKLAFNETFFEQPDLIQAELDRYNKVTKADVMRVYEKYIKGQHKVVMRIVPLGQLDQLKQADTYTFPGRQLAEVASVDEADLVVRRTPVTFDRRQVPATGPNPQIDLPEVWRSKFDNGIEIIGTQTAETPTVSILFSMEGGPLLDDIQQAGLATLTAAMMNESTEHFTTVQLTNELELLGSKISFSAAGRYTNVSVSSLTKNLDQTLTLLAEKLFYPKFEQADFDRVKAQMLEGIKQSEKNPGAVAARAFKEVLYGSNNRIALPDGGTLSTLSSLTLDDVKGFYQRYYSPSQAKLVVVGDVKKKEILEKLVYLQQWSGAEYQISEYQQFPTLDSNKVYFVHQEQATQSVINLGYRTMPFDVTGEFFTAQMMNFNLGGNFNSRINLNLREDKGYTYGANSGFTGGKTLGWFKASTKVKQDHTGDAINEIVSEMTALQEEGLQADEIAFLQSAVSQGEALSYETPGQKGVFLRRLLTFDLDLDYIDERNARIASLTAAELHDSAKQWLQTDKMQIIVVGDRKTVMQQLQALPYEIVEMTLLP